MKHLSSIAALGAIAHASMGRSDHPAEAMLKIDNSFPTDMAEAFARMGATLRAIPDKRRHSHMGHITGGLIMHNNLMKKKMALSARRKRGRFARDVFGSPAKPNLRSTFHVRETAAV